MNQPEFGVRLPVAGPLADRKAIVTSARAAESMGFDAVWVHDFLVWTRHQDRTHVSCGAAEIVTDDTPPRFFESLTNMAFLAGMTESVRIGVAVLCVPYRMPVLAARQIANIDVLSEGRVILGVGPGGGKGGGNKDFEVLGIPRIDKYSRTRDHIAAMKAIWANGESRYQGPYTTFPQDDFGPSTYEFYPKPIQRPHPPLWVSGWSRRGMELVADVGDGWIPGRISPDEFPERIEALRRLRQERGRDPRFSVALECFVSVHPSGRVARQRAEATLKAARTGFQPRKTSGEDPGEVFSRASLVGSLDEATRRVVAFIEAGVEHFELKFIYRTVDELIDQMDAFATAVIPAARSQTS